MAQFFTDFDEFSTGAVGTVASGTFTVQLTPGGDFTNDIVDLGSGDHALQIARVSTAQGVTLITYDAMSGTGDFEAAVKLTLTTTSDQNAPIGPALIASDNQFYAWRATGAPTSTTWRLSLFDGATGSASAAIGTASISFTEPTAGTPFWLMIGRTGTTIYGSVWLDGAGKPGSPSMSGTNATLTTVAPGMATFDNSDEPFTFLIFGAGSGGDEAPITAPSSAQTVEIGLPEETDSALAVTGLKEKAITQPSETDSCLAMAVNGSSVFLDVAHERELKDEGGGLWASVAGWEYAWYDDPDDVLTGGVPVGTGTFDTDSNGAARIEVPGTTLAAGASGALVIRHPDYPTPAVQALVVVPIGP